MIDLNAIWKKVIGRKISDKPPPFKPITGLCEFCNVDMSLPGSKCPGSEYYFVLFDSPEDDRFYTDCGGIALDHYHERGGASVVIVRRPEIWYTDGINQQLWDEIKKKYHD